MKGYMMLLTKIVTTAAALALVAGAGIAVSAPAQAAVLGATEVTLKSSVTTRVQAYNVSIYATNPGVSNISSKGQLKFAFPITAIKNGQVLHEGSILISHNYYGSQRTVELRNLRIDATGRTVNARVLLNGANQGRIDVFTTSGGEARGTSLRNVKVNLAAGIASVANNALGTHVFVDKMRLGTAAGLLIR